jgi:predicted TIM-barrel fold metal-dependent hydrolase
MRKFIFSADGHIREPYDLFESRLPKALIPHSPHQTRDDTYITVRAGSKIILKTRIQPKVAIEGQEDFGRPNLKGGSELGPRMEDMAKEGIDAEIIFPSLGMFTFLLDNREAEVACAEIYNDWNNKFLSGHLDTFVRCGTLPIINLDDTVHELERLAKMGFTAALLPSIVPPGAPKYNNPVWDKVFDAAQRLDIVLVIHTATGLENIHQETGPGGALVNYTVQMNDAINSILYLVAGGVLDRFPKVKVAIVESGASWLDGLAERMDEVYHGHHMFVQPKLSVPPSEIIKRQIVCSFQYDRGAIMSRSVTGTAGLMWGSDYPHHEGTFPHSREVRDRMFDGIDISEKEKAEILGLNGARLFRLPIPEWAEAA